VKCAAGFTQCQHMYVIRVW